MLQPYAFGKRLREVRQRCGWSQIELGKRAGVHHMLISKLERGQNQDVKGETLRKLAVALGVSADVLLGIGKATDAVDDEAPAFMARAVA